MSIKLFHFFKPMDLMLLIVVGMGSLSMGTNIIASPCNGSMDTRVDYFMGFSEEIFHLYVFFGIKTVIPFNTLGRILIWVW